jgi:hypothetical protein
VHFCIGGVGGGFVVGGGSGGDTVTIILVFGLFTLYIFV